MGIIQLSNLDLVWSAGLVAALAVLAWMSSLGVSRDLLIASIRTAVQLMLAGVVLKVLFANAGLGWVGLMALVMLLVAAWESHARQRHRLDGVWGVGLNVFGLFISSFSLLVFALLAVIEPHPWYQPQYSIPLLGMLLGNTMNAVALGMDRLNSSVIQQQAVIEARLALGHPWQDAMTDIRRDSVRVALVPVINAMAAAGVVSLPGMMTGQILAGIPPLEAVKYQIFIMFCIAVTTGSAAILVVSLGAHRLFDRRQRLCLDRLRLRGG